MAGIDGTILVGNNSNAGEVSGSGASIDTILKRFDNETFSNSAGTYQNKVLGAYDGPGAGGGYVIGTDSLFNPFYMFNYAKFRSTSGGSYSADLHRDDFSPLTILSNVATTGVSGEYQKDQRIVENPSADAIIDWARETADRNKEGTTLGPTPYQWNDFLWCKWYGRIPNNRMLTLRRYPIPVEDNLQIAQEKMPLIPIAQAVTWWGEGTENKLDNVLGMTYGFKWSDKDFGDVQSIGGNEIDVAAILDIAGVNDQTARNLIAAALFNDENNPYQGSGFDKIAQDWVKDAYGREGAYWNRVLGPVNVVTKTQMRERGFDYSQPISLNFTYKLRAYSRINPKVAMLDLISNFLSLTHNKAEFWGGAIRYFQKTGYVLPGLGDASQYFEDGNFIKGATAALEALIARIQGAEQEVQEFMNSAVAGGMTEEQAEALADDKLRIGSAAQKVVGSWVKDLIQKPLMIRSLLDGRAVGEWHLTVGNPMNPLAVIGNLCMDSVKVTFSDSLGMDDFPEEINFRVTLKPGRDRAKQDIESMFNLGGGSMYFSALPQPSSGFNTFGERNSQLANRLNTSENQLDEAKQQNPGGNSYITNSDSVDGTTPTQSGAAVISEAEAANLANFYRTKVANAYGEKFAASAALSDYFLQLKTKD